MFSRACALLAAAGLAALTVAQSASAAITLTNGQSVLLSTILAEPDRGVIISDKLFTFQSWTSSQFNPSNVFISGFIANNPLDGIGFDITGGFGDVSPGDSIISEFNLRYTVEVLPAFLAQGFRIKDVGLTFNGNATSAGSYSRVDETIFDALAPSGTNLLGQLSAFSIPGQPDQLQDFRDFSPRQFVKLEVNKDVKFFANGQGGTATASFVRQSFSQVIPAPSAAALIGLGGLFVVRRRR